MIEKKKIRIDIYDADGELCETVGGRMGADEIINVMVEALRNDGIPVLRKAEKATIKLGSESGSIASEAMDHAKKAKVAMQEIAEAIKGSKPMFPPRPCNESITPLPMPLIMRWQVGDIEFSCSGAADDVLDAQDDFFERFPENI